MSWVFHWDKIQKGKKAELLCFTIKLDSRFSSLVKNCEPDYLLEIAKSPGSGNNLSSGDNDFFKFIQDPLKTCSLVNFECSNDNNCSPSYWAQEMIGADLAKEEVEKALRRNGKSINYYDVLDGSYRFFKSSEDHPFKVNNLIAGSGSEAVLPDQLKDNKTFFGELLSDVQKYDQNLCRTEDKNKSCHQPPSFINQSMTFGNWEGYIDNCRVKDEITPYLQYMIEDLKEACQSYNHDCKAEGLNLSDEQKEICEDRKHCENISRKSDEQIKEGLCEGSDDNTAFYEVIKNISSTGAILVYSSGNDHSYETSDGNIDVCGYWESIRQERLKKGKDVCNNYDDLSEDLSRASKELGVIVVGSVSASGERSGFSQEGAEVTIMAPGDDVTTRHKGKLQPFTGTSASAPLVTASLVGFEVLSGYHPTEDEAKTLLKKTALPHHANNGKNGAGIVNAYKLARVGKRLREKCKDDTSCIKDQINENNEIFNFPEDKGLSEVLGQAFPECYVCEQFSSKSSISCNKKQEAFTRLRKASLLNPENKRLWKDLACIYGNTTEDIFKTISSNYDKISHSPLKNAQKITSCQNNGDCVLVGSLCNSYGLTGLDIRSFLYSFNKKIFNINTTCIGSKCKWERSCMKRKCPTDRLETSMDKEVYSLEDESTDFVTEIIHYTSQCHDSKCVVVKGNTETFVKPQPTQSEK